MTRLALFVLLVCSPCANAFAQASQSPSRIGFFVVDVHATFPRFPSDAQLAASRGIGSADLPGLGLGVDVGAHVYVFKWRAVTFGVGGELMTARAHSTPGGAGLATVTERYTSIAPQLSLNFGGARGWSYLSGGIGPSIWSIVPEGSAPLPADSERLKTLNYGGGARWFSKKHVAFSFDVRFYAINPSTPAFGFPASPRTTLLVIGAGVSLR